MTKKKKSILDYCREDQRAVNEGRSMTLPDAMIQDIEIANKARESGEPISLSSLVRGLLHKHRFDISHSQLRRRILNHVGRESW